MRAAATIRAATAADVSGIRAVAAATWRATYAGLIPDQDIARFLDTAYSAERVLNGIARQGDGYLVAVEEETVVGYAFAGPNRDGDAELFALYVLPESQGRGVGRRPWDGVAALLAGGGFPEMRFWVLEGNAPARRFYERRGAFLTGAQDVTVGEGLAREVGYRVAFAGEHAGSSTSNLEEKP